MAKYKQGVFKPLHPEKYKGDLKKNPPVYRSGWELKVMVKFDNHPDVLQWSSEGVVIPYKSPIDNKYHRYFVDFYVKLKDVHGNIVEKIIEVKPKAQVMEPKKRKNQQDRTFLREVMTWGVNQAKWKAAEAAAKNKGWDFEIFTEDDINVF
jgi:hypothetical protein